MANPLITAKKDLYNGGKCFTKGNVYEVINRDHIHTNASLMEAIAINDMNEQHLIGGWWRDFEIDEELD